MKCYTIVVCTLIGLHTFIVCDRNEELIASAEQNIQQHAYQDARTELLASAATSTEAQTLFRIAIDLIKIGAFRESVDILLQLNKKHPTNTAVLYNIGYALKSGGWIDEAIPYYHKVLALEPEHDSSHLALGYAYLNKGDFARGWPHHEWYLKKSGKYAPELREFIAQDSLSGKRILLIPEGGLGDTIHFIQCAQLLRNKGAYVIASVQKPLFKLLQRCDCVNEVISGVPPTLQYDARVTYMSLPAALYLDETTMPKRTPYLFADPTLVDFWRKQLENNNSFKIGLCWQADLFHDESRLPVAHRSIPLKLLAQLANIPGVTLYSLQMHEHNAACCTPALKGKIKTFEYPIDTEHGSFMDTAALITTMDLVISVDTSIAHLAAALGKPTWLLLSYMIDWRWLIGRTDSPWYPTMRIFKQPAPFDWQSVIDDIATCISSEKLLDRVARY